jgi:hypothetical protein
MEHALVLWKEKQEEIFTYTLEQKVNLGYDFETDRHIINIHEKISTELFS